MTPASISTELTMRARVAPSALRTASACPCAEMRTSCRCATFAQAISSSTPTAASHSHSDVRTSPVSASRSGTARSAYGMANGKLLRQPGGKRIEL